MPSMNTKLTPFRLTDARRPLLYSAYNFAELEGQHHVAVTIMSRTTGEIVTAEGTVSASTVSPWIPFVPTAVDTIPPSCRKLLPDEIRIMDALKAGPLQLKELVGIVGCGRSRLALICSLLVEAGAIVSGREGYALA